ncbi:MAG: N-acetyl-gamma-glutamyl-phosphate reductase [Tissierellia bacterium]|nr:N-acetyl-gamma-glutamyl-phosphate reductase [Tissierellia bacterium]
MIKVGILGSTGYAGGELTRLLASREDIELVFLDSNSFEGRSYTSLYPNLRGAIDLSCTSLDIVQNEYFSKIDVLFCALPHGLTQKAVKAALDANLKVIDLSADFRLKDPVVYEEWYDTPHIAQEELKTAVYGLCEVYREQIPKTDLIANPGCYPTSVLLALYPLMKEKLVGTSRIISDSKSGVSGGGRSLRDGNLYSQASENLAAYGVGQHRHTPEMEEQLSLFAQEPVQIQFTPHLVPMLRGILSTIYVENTGALTEQDLAELYHQYYGDEYFIRITGSETLPITKAVAGSNFCDIGYKVDTRTGNIVLVSVIDNLIKGASGQAIQNMNLLFGIEESKGLTQLPVWP